MGVGNEEKGKNNGYKSRKGEWNEESNKNCIWLNFVDYKMKKIYNCS
jgi:hypothetical protein